MPGFGAANYITFLARARYLTALAALAFLWALSAFRTYQQRTQ
ncbi:hypothetical protein [Nocardia sp. NPDC004860]